MRRNTSFFWASDDLRYNASDDDDGDGGGGGDENESNDHHVVTLGIGISSSIDEDEHDDVEEPTSNAADLRVRTWSAERVPLNRAFDGSYGSANGVGENGTQSSSSQPPILRRKLFDTKPATAISKTTGDRYSSPVKTFPAAAAKDAKSIRFQVVIWHIGTIDVQTGFVKMRFRLTLFWTDEKTDAESSTPNKSKNDDAGASGGGGVWVMDGRQHAYRKKRSIPESGDEMIDVPPVSILNAVEFETVDAPEITMVDAQTRGMRWTCMYSATLFQGDHMSVKDFPHDEHQIKLKLGILAHRGRGGRWDHNIHELALANARDSQGSTRVPHGLVVDHCHVPDFGFDPNDLHFEFIPLTYGGWKRTEGDSCWPSSASPDVYLQVTLPVRRQSGHYDTSILPILVMLNIIAISCLTRNFNSATAATEIMLGIAFVQVGIRLTLDSRLPSVGYQIKMQQVMNGCFWLLCGLVLESNFVFFLVKKRGWGLDDTDRIDLGTGCVAFVYNLYIIVTYFRGRGRSMSKAPA